jgi:hypothetical protein
MYAEVEVKVERRSDSFFLSLDLSLNFSEYWRTFSAYRQSGEAKQ